jgi:hypothetical protein
MKEEHLLIVYDAVTWITWGVLYLQVGPPVYDDLRWIQPKRY